MDTRPKTIEEIIKTTIMPNKKRQSKYIDTVHLWKGVPLFSWIDLNVTELCNRVCTFCPRSDPQIYPNQNFHMSLDLVQKIADELREYQYQGGVIFSGFGEPVMHNDFTNLMAIFGKDIHTEVVTNGDKLTKNYIQDLYNAGLDMLLVSMYDGPHQIDYFHDLFKKADIEKNQYVLRDRWYGEESDYGLILTNRTGTVTSGKQKKVDQNRPCYYTHYMMQIDWNGDALLCVQDWTKAKRFGNVQEKTLFEIWTSKELHQFRTTLGSGSRCMNPCENCNVTGTLHGRNHIQSWSESAH